MRRWLIVGGVCALAIGLLGGSGLAQSSKGAPAGPPGEGYAGGPSAQETERTKAYYLAWKKFGDDTAELREQLWLKRHQMAALLANPETKQEELLAKQQEILDLQGDYQRRSLRFLWELNRRFPGLAQDPYGGCYGPAMGLESGPGPVPGGPGFGCGPGPGMAPPPQSGDWGYGGGYGPGYGGPGPENYGPGWGYGQSYGRGPGWGYGRGYGRGRGWGYGQGYGRGPGWGYGQNFGGGPGWGFGPPPEFGSGQGKSGN